jgi:hypothetical protein
MSEVQSRPSAPRGRGSARGGRGGYSSRGGRGGRGHATNGDKAASTPTVSIEDEGEVGQLKKQYGSKVSTIKEMFPDWTDEDVVFALQETDGDLETTVGRITDGEAPNTQLIPGELAPILLLLHSPFTDISIQVRSHSGAKYRRPRKTDLDQRSRTLLSHLSAMLPMYLGFRAVVELALILAEAAVVAQIEAEVEEVAELPSHTQMVHARRTIQSLFLRLRRAHGIPRPRMMQHQPGILKLPLRSPPRIAGVLLLLEPSLQLLPLLRRLLQALFLMVLRRAGQAF